MEKREHVPIYLRRGLCLTEYSASTFLTRKWSHEHTMLQEKLETIVPNALPRVVTKKEELFLRGNEQPLPCTKRLTGVN